VGGGAIERATGLDEFACTLTTADEDTSPEAEAVIVAKPAAPDTVMVPYPTVWLTGIVAPLTVSMEVSEEVTLTGVAWIVLAGRPAASATTAAKVAPLLGLPAWKRLGSGKSRSCVGYPLAIEVSNSVEAELNPGATAVTVLFPGVAVV
jgi:hypothetical protein